MALRQRDGGDERDVDVVACRDGELRRAIGDSDQDALRIGVGRAVAQHVDAAGERGGTADARRCLHHSQAL